ncbi:MAG TPA: 1-acyl-sn-glycerol-3-phosphate acyltransferase [Anaerolineales bacterium]|nr:1-acyl-sn-glycerol-3-phosphate acyltransferase [Anaerolineales bacterium]
MTRSQLDALTQINLNDLVSSFGWENYPLLASTLRRLFIGPARTFARHMVDFDNATGQVGLSEAARQTLRAHYVKDVRVHGSEHIPANEPALFLSNHPGMVDTLALFSAIKRPDLRIIALHRPFLISLVNVSHQLSYISDNGDERIRTTREISSHLRKGGAALTFPAGNIEPDPTVYNDASNSLNNWTDSAGVFIRFARDTKIVPVLVSGVIWDKAVRHFITRLKRTRFERDKLATAIQSFPMMTYNARPTTVHVQFAKPITLEEVGSTETHAIHKVIIERMRGLLSNKPKDEGVSAL